MNRKALFHSCLGDGLTGVLIELHETNVSDHRESST
jgi:hypothetical protein